MHTTTLLQAAKRYCRTGSWLTGLLLLTNSAAFAQLSGAYTINSAQATAGTNYASFTAAVAALTAGGVSGPVTFTVSGGPYTEQISLASFTGSSATNRVTFNGGGRTIQFGSSTSIQRAVITLSGADYVTLNNLVVDATVGGTSTATYGWGIQLLNNSDNNVISNCIVTADMSSTNSTNFAGIISNASTTSPTTTGTTASQNLTITGNTITGGYYGIAVVGSGVVATPTPGISIINNAVLDFAGYGVYIGYLGGAQVRSNNIARPTRTVNDNFFGVYIGPGSSGSAVEKNRIHQAFPAGSTTTSGVNGIYAASFTAATATTPNDVVNNLLYDLNGNGLVYGIFNGSSSYSRFYFNTITLDDQTNVSTNSTFGFYQTTGAGVDFQNNIVRVTRSGSGASYALFMSSVITTFTSNYNDLVGSGISFFTGSYAGTNYTTLANWRTANSSAYDQNSISIQPQFVGAAAGNLQPNAGGLNGIATPLARVADDFTGAVRGATPDIGAYEFTPAADNVFLESIDSPAAPVAAGARTVTVTIRNNGTALLNTVRLDYALNGATAIGQTPTIAGGLAAGATRSLSFTVPATLLSGSNTLTVTASLPNGSTTASSSAQTVTVVTALAGTYTINKLLPTGGTNFISFMAAADVLNTGGVLTPVRFNVLNGPYAEQFSLREIPGASATDSIVVDGGASKQTLSYTGTGTQPAAVLLNGTDYLTLQNLTIDASAGTTYGIGVHLVGQANNNRVSNCVLLAPGVSITNTANAGIAASGTTTSNSTAGDANNLRIENNTISGGYYGVVLTGASTIKRGSDNRVTDNEIRDFYSYGLSVANNTGAQLLGNNIHRTSRAGVTFFYGINLAGSVSTAIERNRIHDTYTGTTTSTAAGYGIYFATTTATAGTENDVVNNLLYNFNGLGTEYGLYNSGSGFARYYHNTVLLANAASASTQVSYGFYQVTTAAGIDFRNNLVSVTRGGAGARYALYFSTAASAITSNNNDLYGGSNPTFITGLYGTATYYSLTDWRTANTNAYDANSLQIDPLFTTPGSWRPSAVQLSAAGTPATLSRVPRDFANATRNNPPAIGAYELTVTPTATRTGSSAALAVFPNPSATGQLTLRLTAATGSGSVELLNTLGQTVRQQVLSGPAEQSISTRGLAAGLYTIRVQIGGEVMTRKVMLQ